MRGNDSSYLRYDTILNNESINQFNQIINYWINRKYTSEHVDVGEFFVSKKSDGNNWF